MLVLEAMLQSAVPVAVGCAVPCRSAQAGPRGDHAAPRV